MSTWEEFVELQLGRGATATEAAGRPGVACFGDLDAEYRALGDGPALVDRSYRGLLEITGADRATWLHNLTTNEVKNLAPGEGRYAFALNVQGRILFDVNVVVREGCIWVDLDGRSVDLARAHFEKHTVIEDISVLDRSDEFVRFGLVGEGAKATLVELGAPHGATMPSLGTTEIVWGDCSIALLRHDFCGPFAVELFVPAGKSVELWQALSDPSGARPAVPAGDDAVQIRRIEAGLPWPFHEITDEYVPAETRQLERAVSFTKGCYLGQEVVERMRTRDVVARQLVGLQIEGEIVPPAGAELKADEDRIVGRVTSACRSPARECVIGMGYVKTASASVGASLRTSWQNRSVAVAVAGLPFAAGYAR